MPVSFAQQDRKDWIPCCRSLCAQQAHAACASLPTWQSILRANGLCRHRDWGSARALGQRHQGSADCGGGTAGYRFFKSEWYLPSIGAERQAFGDGGGKKGCNGRP